MLSCTSIFRNFEITFLSELTFLLKSDTFAIDDLIFEEGEFGTSIYFLTKGSIILIHKQTRTYIKELEIDDFLGEYSFFSEKKRMASARSKNFCEVLRIEKLDFLKTIKSYPESEDLYE